MYNKKFNHRDRLERTLSNYPTDRTPVALWRHFPVDDQSPGTLAAATINYQNTYDFDLVKVTPASSFCLKDWGATDEWRGSTEGTRVYSNPVINKPEDWSSLSVLDPTTGHLGDQLTVLQMIVNEMGERTPVIQTIFSPMAQAKNLAGGQQLIVHLRKHPEALHEGLRVIAESTQRFIEAARQTGISGIFYAVQHAQFGLLSEAEFSQFGRAYDLQVLESLNGLWLNMLHLHGNDVMFSMVVDYPIQVINWHDQDTYPSLKEALPLFPGVLCGGLQRERTMVLGTPEQVTQEVRQAIEATNGQRLILGTGCVTPITAPYGNLIAARQSVEK